MPTSMTGRTMKESIVHHLNGGKPVWLTGHTKGGAVATTAAARLVCGEDAVDIFWEGSPRLSVVTFNSPKALELPFAEAYDETFEQFGLGHLRVEHADDVVHKVPAGLRHVGRQIDVESLPAELFSFFSGLFAAASAHGLRESEDSGGGGHYLPSSQPRADAAQSE